MAHEIYRRLGRTVTTIRGKGLISGDKEVMYVVINRIEISELRSIADDMDEEAMFREVYKRELLPHSFHIMILPTYQCNLRCWYCIQKHQDMIMSENTIKCLEKHIEKYIDENDIKDFKLSWFGGEPLLEFEIIVKLTTFAKTLCELKKISFNCAITTNGTLIKKEWIPIFRNLEIFNYQITIDGYREQHNAVKRLPGKSAFDTSLNNIRMIVEQIPEASVNLRINYTEKSDPIKIIQSINEVIPQNIREKVTIIPCKVWQIDDRVITNQFKETLRSKDFIGSYKYYNTRLGMCYVDRTHYETIFPNGRVGKCDNENPESRTIIGNRGREYPIHLLKTVYADIINMRIGHAFPH